MQFVGLGVKVCFLSRGEELCRLQEWFLSRVVDYKHDNVAKSQAVVFIV